MAFTTFLMTVTMASMVAASFPFSDDDFFNSKMFRYVTPLPLPKFPNFPNLNLPTPPPLIWPHNFPNLNFPQANFQNIASQGGDPERNFNGAAVMSHSSSVRGPDGKIHRQGGTTMLVNDNGKVTMQQFGNAPPVEVSQYTNPPVSGNY